MLFVVQKLPRLAEYQKSLLVELQLTGKYQWIAHDLEFRDASLPTRFEQLRPLGEELQCDTAVWIDEGSTERALVQILAIAPGRTSLRSIEVNLQTQTAADTAIVVNELLDQTDTDLSPRERPAEVEDTAAPASDGTRRDTPETPGVEAESKPDFILFATMQADAASYDPFGVLLGGGLDGCLQAPGGWGGCLLLRASGERDRGIGDIDISQVQFRPGLSVYFSKRFSRFAFGPELSVFPVLQYVKVEPAGFAAERETYLNGAASLAVRGRWYLGKRLVLQIQLGAMVWFRTLTFKPQSTDTPLFDTPLLSPLAAVSLGTAF